MLRGLKVGSAIFGGLVLVAIGAFFLFFPRIGAWVFRSRVVPKLEHKLGRDVEVRSIEVGFGRVILEGVSVAGENDSPLRRMATVERIQADFDFWPALRGDVRVKDVVITRPAVALVRAADGTDNWSDLVTRLRERDAAPEDSGEEATPGRPPFQSVKVIDGAVDLDDRSTGVRFAARGIGADAVPGGAASLRLEQVAAETDIGPSATAKLVTLEADLSDPRQTAKISFEGGTASIWPHVPLTGIRGSVEPAGPSRAQIEVQGGYGGVEGTLWHASGWLDPRTEDAELHLVADRFTLDKLAPILGGTPVQRPENASIETTLDVKITPSEVHFDGQVKLTGLTVYHPWLAESPIREVGFRSTAKGKFGRASRVLELEALGLDIRGLHVDLTGTAALPGGRDESGAIRTEPRVAVRAIVPNVTCQQVLDAFPRELTPRLQGFRVKGDFSADVRFEADWANLDATVLDGSVGIYGCRVVDAPEEFSTDRLQGTFEHFVEIEQDKWMSFMVGPSNSNYVPLHDVSPHVLHSFVNTEDAGFWRHRGYIPREFRSALVKNLKEKYFKFGASSITMQFVKNVMLYREKTLARKLQELFLTHYVESTLGKDRILEIYVNVIEFGPGIYGIGPAARHYFGKHPRDLNPVEAAFFSSILPSPKKRHLQYCDGELSRTGDAKVQRILKLLHERKKLTDEEYQTALQTPLVFDRSDAPDPDQCKKLTRRYMKNARPTLPPRANN